MSSAQTSPAIPNAPTQTILLPLKPTMALKAVEEAERVVKAERHGEGALSILGLNCKNGTPDTATVRRAFIKLSKKLHPDKSGIESSEAFQVLERARRSLLHQQSLNLMWSDWLTQDHMASSDATEGDCACDMHSIEAAKARWTSKPSSSHAPAVVASFSNARCTHAAAASSDTPIELAGDVSTSESDHDQEVGADDVPSHGHRVLRNHMRPMATAMSNMWSTRDQESSIMSEVNGNANEHAEEEEEDIDDDDDDDFSPSSVRRLKQQDFDDASSAPTTCTDKHPRSLAPSMHPKHQSGPAAFAEAPLAPLVATGCSSIHSLLHNNNHKQQPPQQMGKKKHKLRWTRKRIKAAYMQDSKMSHRLRRARDVRGVHIRKGDKSAASRQLSLRTAMARGG